MDFESNVGPISGPLCNKHGYMAIHVFQPGALHTPIGMALAAGQDEDGLVLWRLTVYGAELPALWIVVEREFRPAGTS